MTASPRTEELLAAQCDLLMKRLERSEQDRAAILQQNRGNLAELQKVLAHAVATTDRAKSKGSADGNAVDPVDTWDLGRALAAELEEASAAVAARTTAEGVTQ